MQSMKWRSLLYAAIIAVAVVYLLPTFVKMPAGLEPYLPKDKIALGLDLQGGMHLVIEVETDKALANSLERYASDLEEYLYNEKIPFDSVKVIGATSIEAKITEADAREKVRQVLQKNFPILKEQKLDESKDGVTFTLQVDAFEAKQLKKTATEQALETIRNRIDQFGVAEPTIQLQGEDQIVIQLPGIKDPKRAIELIGKTALLEFKLVDEGNSVEDALKGDIPADCELLYQRDVNPKTGEVKKTPYVLKKKTLLTGDRLVDAKVQIDSRFNEPYVSMEFDARGGKIFERVTAKNIKKRLAIILDNNVYSAPVIQDRIAGGHAQITGRFGMEEARDLAIVLRAGSLPAPVKILEKRSVGPSLGQDSINQGIKAMLIGCLAVIIFMIVYYRLSGIVANLALVLNIILLLAVLAGFGATLTVPGLAGIVLTIGMAVDANVLIYERIREELRNGKTVKAALDMGFSRAFATIFDSNLTTIISAVFLFQFGTGPVKGFAVTLTIGLLANMFTAVAVTRLIFDYFVLQRRVKTISI
jgi:preprotein translocase subunit SecD